LAGEMPIETLKHSFMAYFLLIFLWLRTSLKWPILCRVRN